jgi:hypothetical protein
MKNLIKPFLVVIALTMASLSFAQVKYGIRAGLNLTEMTLNLESSGLSQKMNTSLHLGGTFEYSLSEKFAIESGLMLSGKGSRIEDTESGNDITIKSTSTISPLYIEVPINGLYILDFGAVKLQLFAGPYFAYAISGKIKTEYTAIALPSGVTLESLQLTNESSDIKFGTSDESNIKGMDFGLNMGAGIEAKNFLIRAQCGWGFTNLDTGGSSTDDELNNRVIGISMGYLFSGK